MRPSSLTYYQIGITYLIVRYSPCWERAKRYNLAPERRYAERLVWKSSEFRLSMTSIRNAYLEYADKVLGRVVALTLSGPPTRTITPLKARLPAGFSQTGVTIAALDVYAGKHRTSSRSHARYR